MVEEHGSPPPHPHAMLAAQGHTANMSSMNMTPIQKLDFYKSQHAIADVQELDLPPVERNKRKCTDFLCLLMFVAYWVTMVALFVFARTVGDPYLLVYGTDNNGNLCGTGNFSDKPFLALPRLTLDVLEAGVSLSGGTTTSGSITFFGVCREACPVEEEVICSTNALAEIPSSADAVTLDDKLRACVNTFLVPAEINPDCFFSKVVQNECFDTLFNTSSLLFRCLPEFVFKVETLEDESGCTKTQETTNFLGLPETKCLKFKTVQKVTTEEPTEIDAVSATFNTVNRKLQEVIGDIVQSAPVIAGIGLGLSSVLSVLYVSLLWCFVGPIIWASLVLIVLLFLVLTLYLYNQGGVITADAVAGLLDTVANEIQEITGNDITNPDFNISNIEDAFSNIPALDSAHEAEYLLAAKISSAVTVLVLILVLLLIPKISKAIKIFTEASHTLRANMCLIIFPPLAAALSLVNGAFFLLGSSYCLTIGEIDVKVLNITVNLDTTVNSTASEFVGVTYANGLVAFLFFGFLWTMNLINGVATLIISHTVSQSYWSTKPGTMHYKSGSIIRAVRETFRFHLGTVAVGACLIAIVQFIRAVASFIDHRTKDIQQKNKLVKYLMISVHCCLWCVEQCVKFVSKNAYIMTAMYGYSFCKSSRKAFFAIAANLATVGAVNFLGEIILRIGQVLVLVICAIASVVATNYFVSQDLIQVNSVIAPLVVVCILAWFISFAVLSIYDVAVDTLLLSYCQDQKRMALRGQESDHKHEGDIPEPVGADFGHINSSNTGAKASFASFVMENTDHEVANRKGLFSF